MTLTPNMSIFVPTNGQELFSASFLAGMQNIDRHGHTGAPTDGVPIGTNGIQDGAITPNKLSFTLFNEDSIQTTNATPTNITTIMVDESTAVTVQGIFVAIRSDATEGLGGDFVGSFRRGTGGTVAQIGSSVINLNEDFSGAPTFTLNANAGTNEIELVCTGEVGKTIVWTVQYQYLVRDTSL